MAKAGGTNALKYAAIGAVATLGGLATVAVLNRFAPNWYANAIKPKI